MIKPFGNEKPVEETLLKIAKMRYQPSPNTPRVSCYDYLAGILENPQVDPHDKILLLGSKHKGDAVCHCVLERDGDVIFDTNTPKGCLKNDLYTHQSTKGVMVSQLKIKHSITVADFVERFSPPIVSSAPPKPSIDD